MIYVLGGGAGLSKCSIIVHIDSGSAVAAYSNAAATTKVKDGKEIGESGDYLITGLNVGTYYVKATKGSQTVISGAITFSADGIKDVILAYPLYIVKAGVAQKTLSGNNVTTQTISGYLRMMQSDGEHMYGYFGPVDVTAYSKLKFQVPSGVRNMMYYGDSYGGCGFGLRSSNSGNPVNNYNAVKRFTDPYYNKTWELGISSLSGNYYVAFDFEGSSNETQYLAASNVWLE